MGVTTLLLLLLLAALPCWAQGDHAGSNLAVADIPFDEPSEPVYWRAFETGLPATAVVEAEEQAVGGLPTAVPADRWVVRRPGWTPVLLNARGNPPDLTLDPALRGRYDIFLGLRAVDPTMTFGLRLSSEPELSIVTAPAATPDRHFDFEFHWKAGVAMDGEQIVLHALGKPVYLQYLKFVGRQQGSRPLRSPIERSVVMREAGRHFAFPGVAELTDGSLAVVGREGDAHVCPRGRIVISRSTDGGRTWAPREVLYESPSDERDPAILRRRDGTLVVSFNTWDSWRADPRLRARYPAETAHMEQVGWGRYSGSWLMTSSDEGRTWSAPRRAPAFSPHGPVEGPDRALYWVGLERREGCQVVAIYRTDDLGLSWSRFSEVSYSRALAEPLDFEAWDEPNLVFLPDGRAICSIRVEVDGYVRQAVSTDGGKSWGWPRRLAVWGFPQQVTNLADGRLLMAYGHRRQPLGVRACLSRDGGRTWDLDQEIVLRHEGGHADLGYPYAIELRDGRIFTVYYYNHQGGDCYLEATWYRP